MLLYVSTGIFRSLVNSLDTALLVAMLHKKTWKTSVTNRSRYTDVFKDWPYNCGHLYFEKNSIATGMCQNYTKMLKSMKQLIFKKQIQHLQKLIRKIWGHQKCGTLLPQITQMCAEVAASHKYQPSAWLTCAVISHSMWLQTVSHHVYVASHPPSKLLGIWKGFGRQHEKRNCIIHLFLTC